ncbi:hypothetical protein ACNF42_08305 [Cuniculiplasma sp. SKW3]|uniref:hypothetical protein n=1 Tax=Cuniculiplasma sp. SKW3 TaxID=3400170 RepID=UPI003FCF24EA
MRNIVKDWERENAFRRLKLMGISIEDSPYLSSQYRNFQEEDEGILPPPLSSLFEEESKKDKNNAIDGPACPVMVIMRKRRKPE